MPNSLEMQNPLSSDRQVVKINDDSTGLLLKDKDVIVENDLIVHGDITADSITADSITANASGMILGYTRIQNDSTTVGDAQITVNSSAMTVLVTAQSTQLRVRFIAPPSGKVEIQFSFWMSATSDGVKFSLSDNASYNEIDETHTYDADQTIYIDESDHNYNTISFSVTGLSTGVEYLYHLAGLASGAGVYILHGRNRGTGNHYPPIIIRAIALPANMTEGE